MPAKFVRRGPQLTAPLQPLPARRGAYTPRAFSAAVKRALFEEDPVCALCGNQIMLLEHAEVDHIVPYSKGGSTVPANGQLTCTTCNRSKGAAV